MASEDSGKRLSTASTRMVAFSGLLKQLQFVDPGMVRQVVPAIGIDQIAGRFCVTPGKE